MEAQRVGDGASQTWQRQKRQKSIEKQSSRGSSIKNDLFVFSDPNNNINTNNAWGVSKRSTGAVYIFHIPMVTPNAFENILEDHNM